MNRELAFKCQMLPANIRKSRSSSYAQLARSGWAIADLDRDLDSALNWANSHCLVQSQEKSRKTRAAKKQKLRGDDALDAMFASVGADPTEIPRKA